MIFLLMHFLKATRGDMEALVMRVEPDKSLLLQLYEYFLILYYI